MASEQAKRDEIVLWDRIGKQQYAQALAHDQVGELFYTYASGGMVTWDPEQGLVFIDAETYKRWAESSGSDAT